MATATCRAIQHSPDTKANNVIPFDSNNQDNDSGNEAYNNNNYSRARARARESDPRTYVTQEIRDAYRDVFGRAMPQCHQDAVNMWVGNGHITPDLVAEAIIYTANAPRPAWAYTRYMIRLAMTEGLKTGCDFVRMVNPELG